MTNKWFRVPPTIAIIAQNMIHIQRSYKIPSIQFLIMCLCTIFFLSFFLSLLSSVVVDFFLFNASFSNRFSSYLTRLRERFHKYLFCSLFHKSKKNDDKEQQSTYNLFFFFTLLFSGVSVLFVCFTSFFFLL